VGGPLEPAALVTSLIQNWTGVVVPRLLAETIDYLTGILLYPLGYWFTSRWVATLGTLAGGLLWGVATWIPALGVFASLACLPFMLGWIPLTWFSLIGHAIYAVVAVGEAERLAAGGPKPTAVHPARTGAPD
jgi:hypothetical protein